MQDSREATVLIDDVLYNIEDEELDPIFYYEILGIDEIIKDNPDFIAFSREEIFNELYDFFKETNKADALTDLFYVQNKTDISNIIFDVDAKNVGFGEESAIEDVAKFAEKVQVLNKLQYSISQKEKNKLFMPLVYDNASKLMRLRPTMDTTAKLTDGNTYPLKENDDINVPVKSAQYATPLMTIDDFLRDKIMRSGSTIFNALQSQDFKTIDALAEAVKPDMKAILTQIGDEKDSYLFDKERINAMLMIFGKSIETIDEADMMLLRDFCNFLKTQPEAIVAKKHKISLPNVTYVKHEYYRRAHGVANLLAISDKRRQRMADDIQKMQDDKITVSDARLGKKDMNDIISLYENGDDIEDLIKMIADYKRLRTLDGASENLSRITKNDAEKIRRNLERLREEFDRITMCKDIYDFHFIDFFSDVKSIKEGNDYSAYDGIPDIYNNAPNFEGENVDDYDEVSGVGASKIEASSLEKYWLSLRFKESTGFVEILKVVLPIILSVKNVSCIDIDFDVLCEELYNSFSGIPSKFNIMRDILDTNSVSAADTLVRSIVMIKPKIALSSGVQEVPGMDVYVKECNKSFTDIFYTVLNFAMAWWSVQIQSDIIDGSLMFDETRTQLSYIDKWALDGLPIKDSKTGVLVYLASILDDVILDGDTFTEQKSTVASVMKVIEASFSERMDRLKIRFKGNWQKKSNKGAETYASLLATIKEKKHDRLLFDYINALIYMPSYKYKKIHKFLLGCCMQVVGKDFVIDSDLIATKRQDLIAAKRKYARSRETYRPNDPLYFPNTEDPVRGVERMRPIAHDINSEIATNGAVDVWLHAMIGVSSLLPDAHIDIFKRGTKETEVLSSRYIDALCKTAGHRPKDLQDAFNQVRTSNRFNQVLRAVSTILHKNIGVHGEDEDVLLLSAIESIRDVIGYTSRLATYADEYNKQDISRINGYVMARAICLPCNPDTSVGVLQASVNVSHSFVSTVAKQIHSTILAFAKSSRMPGLDENMDYINKVRENNKNKTLSSMNTKTQDERELINQLKKIGLGNMNDESVPVNKDAGDGEEAGEDIKEQEDYDDDALDKDDYGFMYD